LPGDIESLGMSQVCHARNAVAHLSLIMLADAHPSDLAQVRDVFPLFVCCPGRSEAGKERL